MYVYLFESVEGVYMNEKHLTVKELPSMERPYEKLEQYGAKSLTDAELLAVIIRTGTREAHSVELASHILQKSGDTPGILGLKTLELPELMEIKGVGRVKALQIIAIGELSRRIAKAAVNRGECFSDPELIAKYYMEDMRHLQREEIILLMMNSKNQIIKDEVISKGTVNSSIISPREVFLLALRYHAVNIVLLHNHPSGDPTPSKEDLLMTARIAEAGKLIGILLMDHLIIGDNKYISLKEKGFL